MRASLPFVSGYRDLIAYIKALELATTIYRVSDKFPREEVYSLTYQIRRSSRSIGAQIAEAWGKRQYVRHFVSKLSGATSEIYETEHWLEIASRCDYLPDELNQELLTKCSELSRIISGMIMKANRFCGQ